MSTNSPRSLNTLSALALAENRITVRDACTETSHEHDCGRSPLSHGAIKATCKALGCRASYCADCDLQVVLADGSTLDLNWDSGIDGYDYAESTADAELLQAAVEVRVEDATAAPVAPVVILRSAIVRATCELAAWNSQKYNLTNIDVNNEYCRISGLVDALELLGADCYGLLTVLGRAKESALPNCINIDALRVCRPR